MSDDGVVPFKGDPSVDKLIAKHPSFGIVLVANWPPPVDGMHKTYDKLVRNTTDCFDPSDHESCYFYPISCLHITVATFHDFKSSCIEDPTEQEALVAKCRALLDQVRNSSSCKTKPWEFRPKSAELHAAAAVMLWEETTGGLNVFRQVLREALTKHELSSCFVPDLCHSTYLRFSKEPQGTTRSKALPLFQQSVAPIMEDWNVTFPVDRIRLVVSRVPYMHPPTEVVETVPLKT